MKSLKKQKSTKKLPKQRMLSKIHQLLDWIIKEFAQFLNFARRSTLENANMLIVFERRGLIPDKNKDNLLNDLEEECKMITGFIRSLKK